MRYSDDEVVQKVVEDLIARGCVFKTAKRGRHNKLVFPNGHKLPIPSHIGDARSAMNFRALVRQIIAKGGLNGNRYPPQEVQ